MKEAYMNKSKMAVITCFVIVIFTMLSPISVFEKYKINAMTFIEDEQINIINKTSKLSNQETKLIFMDIKNRLIKKYDNFELKNFRAIFVDADNNPNYVDFDVIADMSSECIPTETEYYKGMLEAANNLTSLLDRDIAQILITEYLKEQWSAYHVFEETSFCYRMEIPTVDLITNESYTTTPETRLLGENKYNIYNRIDISEHEVDLIKPEDDIPYNQNRIEKIEGMKALIEEIDTINKYEPRLMAKSVKYTPSNAVAYAKKHAKDIPEFSEKNGLGSDCANFLSKCINAGGIPEDEKGLWYKSKKKGAYAGVNWMRTGFNTDNNGKKTGVKTYMVDKGYFKKVNSSSKAKKGGFLFWNSSSHVALICSNANGKLTYSEHSNVQLKYVTKLYSSEDVTFYNPDF